MKQYSWSNTIMLLNGVSVTGHSESSPIISIQRAIPQHMMEVGARGEAAVATSADISGSVTFQLMQTAKWNETLFQMALLSQATGISGTSATFMPIQMQLTDIMGQAVAVGVDGVIVMQPGMNRATGFIPYRWTLRFAQVHFIYGGYTNVGLSN